jgi:hypothetical protein
MKFLLVLVLLGSAVAQNVAPAQPKMSDDFKKAGGDAFDAISLVSDSIGSKESDVEFQPRMLDAEKALQRAKRGRDNDVDNAAFSVLEAWLEFKDLARSDRDLTRSKKDWDGSTQCGAEAHLLFDPHALSVKGKQVAEQKTCLKLRDSRLAELDAAVKK